MTLLRILFVLTLAKVGGNYAETITVGSAELDLNKTWGLHTEQCNDTLQEFKVEFTEEIIEDLSHRIKNRRQFAASVTDDFSIGFNSNQMYVWMDFWANNYTFSAREDFLNQYSHYKICVQGLLVHFIWIKPTTDTGRRVIPLMILHGFPGSVREFYETIPMLVAEADSRGFDLEIIIPSLPGFGFSDPAALPGMDAVQIGIVLRNMMQKLGFTKFFLQGGDWGGIVCQLIATMFPEEVLGYHSNMAVAMCMPALMHWIAGANYPDLVVSSELADRMYPLSTVAKFGIQESAYLHTLATKPESITIALSDSPSGLLAYLLQLVSSSSAIANSATVDGALLDHFTREQLLDNLMIYWTTNSISTAARIYAETLSTNSTSNEINGISTPVPTWTIHAKHEIVYMPPTLLRYKFPNLVNSTVLEGGGHFLALELPEVFAKDVVKAVAEYIAIEKKVTDTCS